MSTTSTAKPVLSEKWYGRLVFLFVVAAIVSFVVSIVRLCMNFMYLTCGSPTEYYYVTAPAPMCALTSFVPNAWAGFATMLVCIVIAWWLAQSRFYWYRQVLSGRVAGSDWYSSPGLYNSGYQEYILYVKGKNRVGQTRTQGYSVTPKAYFAYNNGDKITFSG